MPAPFETLLWLIGLVNLPLTVLVLLAALVQFWLHRPRLLLSKNS